MPAPPRARVRVFISAKSEDYGSAEAVYRHLADAGVPSFFSRESLPELGSADYRREIDRALDEAEHLIVVTSSVDRVLAPWVEAEWGFFINEKRSGRKRGNLVTVVVGTLKPADLPPSLRYYEVIPFEAGSLDRFTMLAMSDDGRTLAAGSHDGVVRLYDFEAVAEAIAQLKRPRLLPPLMDLRAHKNPVTSVVFFPDSRRVVTCAMEPTLIVWDVPAGSQSVTLHGNAGEQFVSACGLDGATLVAALADGRLRLWDQG